MFRQCSKTIEITARVVLLILLLEYVQPVLALFDASEVYAAEYMCGQDQNGDGSVDSAGETAGCINTTQGQLCPLGAVDCTRGTSNGNPGCSEGSTLNQQTVKCEAPVVCPVGSLYNNLTNGCELASSNQVQCSLNNQYYPTRAVCNAACSSTVDCTPTPVPISISIEDDPPFVYQSNNRSKITGSGNKLKFYQEEIWYPLNLTTFYLRATVTVPGAAFSGTTGSFFTGSSLTVTSNQICRNQYCITVTGGTMSGSLLSGDDSPYSQYMHIGHDNALITKYYDWQSARLYFNQPTCPLSEGSSCTGASLRCSAGGTCTNTQGCPSGFTSVNGVCTSTNPCAAGFALNSTTDLCEKTPDCTGICNPTQVTSTQYQCPVDAAFYSDSAICTGHCAQACTKQNTDTTKYQCMTTDAMFDSQPLCNATCAVGVVCQIGDICPLGNKFTCMSNAGTKQCSTNACVDIITSTAEITDVDDKMLQDDGPHDAEGNCLGQIYIFTGRGMRCRPPGLQVGLLNDCCQSDQPAIGDSVGTLNQVGTAISAIKTVYEIAQVAYYTNAFVTTGVIPTGISSSSVAVQSAVAAGIDGGAAEAGIQSYLSSMLNPTTIAIAVVTMVVMRILMGNGCDQKDIETALLRDSKMCHFVGNYCAKKWDLIGCVQRAKGFCCYNSKMARIIHEQGRPQLIAFQPNGAWGTGETPNCRGFLPDEFQQLDFSKIDLSEYFGDIQTKAQNVIQQNSTDKINQFYQNIH